MEHAQFYTNP
jgi:hypothetical protein